jgi:hypothetical protein
MRSHILTLAVVMAASLAAPAALAQTAETYERTIANARNGQGYEPAAIVAGWERDADFSVLAIARDGDRRDRANVAADWKATLTIAPRTEAEDEEEEDERYLPPGAARPAERAEARPEAAPAPPLRVVTWSSRTCPAIMRRVRELRPLTSFTFDPPELRGEAAAPGDGRQGLDLWVRAGAAELNKSAESPDSALGRWFIATVAALEACPPAP